MYLCWSVKGGSVLLACIAFMWGRHCWPSSLTIGLPSAISPRPPLLDYSATAFGSPIGASLLQLSSQGSSVPVYTSTWKDALALGGLSGVKDGQNYALVLVGPRPNNAADKWWNGPRLVALPADP